jgi:hypothetical protein
MFRTTTIESVFPVQSSQSVCVLLCSIHRSHVVQSNDVGCRNLLNQNSFELRSRRISVFEIRIQSNATRPVFRNRVSVLFSTSTLSVRTWFVVTPLRVRDICVPTPCSLPPVGVVTFSTSQTTLQRFALAIDLGVFVNVHLQRSLCEH